MQGCIENQPENQPLLDAGVTPLPPMPQRTTGVAVVLIGLTASSLDAAMPVIGVVADTLFEAARHSLLFVVLTQSEDDHVCNRIGTKHGSSRVRCEQVGSPDKKSWKRVGIKIEQQPGVDSVLWLNMSTVVAMHPSLGSLLIRALDKRPSSIVISPLWTRRSDQENRSYLDYSSILRYTNETGDCPELFRYYTNINEPCVAFTHPTVPEWLRIRDAWYWLSSLFCLCRWCGSKFFGHNTAGFFELHIHLMQRHGSTDLTCSKLPFVGRRPSSILNCAVLTIHDIAEPMIRSKSKGGVYLTWMWHQLPLLHFVQSLQRQRSANSALPVRPLMRALLGRLA